MYIRPLKWPLINNNNKLLLVQQRVFEGFLRIGANALCTRIKSCLRTTAKGGLELKKNMQGQFFAKPTLEELTNYVIRHIS